MVKQANISLRPDHDLPVRMQVNARLHLVVLVSHWNLALPPEKVKNLGNLRCVRVVRRVKVLIIQFLEERHVLLVPRQSEMHFVTGTPESEILFVVKFF